MIIFGTTGDESMILWPFLLSFLIQSGIASIRGLRDGSTTSILPAKKMAGPLFTAYYGESLDPLRLQKAGCDRTGFAEPENYVQSPE